eukprot:SAG31_NODE_15927_length_731_cov_1.200949_1_plen_25_part_10
MIVSDALLFFFFDFGFKLVSPSSDG